MIAPHSDVIIVAGHGDSDQTTGQHDAVLLKVGQYNEDEIRGKVIYAFSCQSGDYLGPDLVNHGATAFLGWTDDYVWLINEANFLTPWNDKLAAPCVMPVIAGLNSLLDGDTVSEVKQVQDDAYDYYAGITGDELVKDMVLFNKSNFVLYGDPQARINARPGLAGIFKLLPPPPMLAPI